MTITPFAAGHMIGGSIWRITSAVGEDVVYAVDYNHRKELHLNSTALSNLFSRPALMIAEADRSVQVPSSAWPANICRTLSVLKLCLCIATHECIHCNLATDHLVLTAIWSVQLVQPNNSETVMLSVVCSGQPQFAEKTRGPKLLDSIMSALRNDGSILMPVDTAGRVLEVMLLLEKHWAINRLSYPLALLSPVAYNTLEFAKSQLEWMNEQVAKEFENSRDKDNPFSMRYAELLLAWPLHTAS